MAAEYIIVLDKNAILPEVISARDIAVNAQTMAESYKNNAAISAASAANSAVTVGGFLNYTSIAKTLDIITKGPFVDLRSGGAIGDGIADDSDLLQSVMGTTFTSKTFLIPSGKNFRITKPLIIPCGCSFIGFCGNSRIIADYSAWQGTDYRAIVVKSREGVNYTGNEYNQVICGFSLFGINNSGVISQGIDFSTANDILVGNAVNYSFYNGKISNILVSGFDTAYNIIECWNSVFENIMSMYCRRALNIEGKSVNLVFDNVKFTNFDKTHTSSVNYTQGVNIDSKFTYTGGVEGRPEGIVFKPGCLIYGAKTNINLHRCLYFRITDSIIDGATGDCIVITDPNNVSIKGCYIYTSGSSCCGVLLNETSISDSKIDILGNHIVGSSSATGQTGVKSTAGVRAGCSINENFINAMDFGIYLNYFNTGRILNNYGRSNRNYFIRQISGGIRTIIDGNVSDDNFAIIMADPSTSVELDIRNNSSTLTKTFFRGKATLLAGATTVNLPNGFQAVATDYYVRALTKAKTNGNIGNFWIAESTNVADLKAVLTCSAAPAANVTIYYEVVAIPYSLTV